VHVFNNADQLSTTWNARVVNNTVVAGFYLNQETEHFRNIVGVLITDIYIYIYIYIYLNVARHRWTEQIIISSSDLNWLATTKLQSHPGYKV
jgi:hypothetical protein